MNFILCCVAASNEHSSLHVRSHLIYSWRSSYEEEAAFAQEADYADGIDRAGHFAGKTRARIYTLHTNHPIYLGQIVVKWRRVMRAGGQTGRRGFFTCDAPPDLHQASNQPESNLTPFACTHGGCGGEMLMGIIFLTHVFRLCAFSLIMCRAQKASLALFDGMRWWCSDRQTATACVCPECVPHHIGSYVTKSSKKNMRVASECKKGFSSMANDDVSGNANLALLYHLQMDANKICFYPLYVGLAESI